mmetsp:Transcript_1201/g.7887  ORF Transcript_1201/g.7887 Transcript_1201/m.7887 type:complete len:90 (-) Transcript_1201:1897-2166(-)
MESVDAEEGHTWIIQVQHGKELDGAVPMESRIQIPSHSWVQREGGLGWKGTAMQHPWLRRTNPWDDKTTKGRDEKPKTEAEMPLLQNPR